MTFVLVEVVGSEKTNGRKRRQQKKIQLLVVTPFASIMMICTLLLLFDTMVVSSFSSFYSNQQQTTKVQPLGVAFIQERHDSNNNKMNNYLHRHYVLGAKAAHSSSSLQTILRMKGGSAGEEVTTSNDDTSSSSSKKPILVVGGTGRVGRIIVSKLLQQNHPVRIIARNRTKAKELFHNTNTNLLTIYEMDMNYFEQYDTILQNAVCGCESIISAMNIIQFSQWIDFVPWRIFRLHQIDTWLSNSSSSSSSEGKKKNHPYYGNYLAQRRLLQIAVQNQVQRYVRISGLTLAYPVYNPITILFNVLLSCTSRWNILSEQCVIQSGIPYVILRPGGLLDLERDNTNINTNTTTSSSTSNTFLQINSSGIVPLPGTIGRTDLADLCLTACDRTVVPFDRSYTLGCRWVGTIPESSSSSSSSVSSSSSKKKLRQQGTKEEGYSNAKECYEQLVQQQKQSTQQLVPEMKPYGTIVGITVYTMFLLTLKCFWSVGHFLFLRFFS